MTLYFTPAPTLSDLRAYSGSFRSNDDLINRVWYPGAYTVQMDTIDPRQANLAAALSGWLNNELGGSGATILVDGAKPDRAVWPGDLGISALIAFLSTGDTLSMKNDLTTLFAGQDSAGCLPVAGPECALPISDTYHLWTLIGVTHYFLYSAIVPGYLALAADQESDRFFHGEDRSARAALGRFGVGLGPAVWGGEEISANALLFQVLQGASFLASIAGDSTAQSLYTATAASVRSAINLYLWDAGVGLYMDVPGSSLHPQDGSLWRSGSMSQIRRQRASPSPPR